MIIPDRPAKEQGNVFSAILGGVIQGATNPTNVPQAQIIDTDAESQRANVWPYLILAVAGIGGIVGLIYLMQK